MGDAAQIRAGTVRKQKTDSRDAFQILKMLLEGRFPRIWIPSPAERDLRQLLQHRVRLVRFRTPVMNQLHALAMGQGLCQRKKLWATKGRNELKGLTFGPWADRCKQELLKPLDRLNSSIEELDRALKKEADYHVEAVCLMEQSGVGPVTALVFVLIRGPLDRFSKSKPVVSYLGWNPTECSGGGKQRLGSISKQGNTMMRYLLVEAAQFDPELRRNDLRLKFRRGSAVAKVAIARKLAVRLYWKLREARQAGAVGSHAG